MPTDFETKVYECIKHIPAGKVSTYKLVARTIGNPFAVRAVGTALKNNPYAPHIPCHRVVKSDGRLGGYLGSVQEESIDVQKKIQLLKDEGVNVADGRIVDFENVVMR